MNFRCFSILSGVRGIFIGIFEEDIVIALCVL